MKYGRPDPNKSELSKMLGEQLDTNLRQEAISRDALLWRHRVILGQVLENA